MIWLTARKFYDKGSLSIKYYTEMAKFGLMHPRRIKAIHSFKEKCIVAIWTSDDDDKVQSYNLYYYNWWQSSELTEKKAVTNFSYFAKKNAAEHINIVW